MSPRIQRALPLYLQITEHFRSAIKTGTLSENEKLPSIKDIATEWDVATATATKAINQLRAEGYVNSTNQGTFVSQSHKLTTGPDRIQMLRATGNGYRPGERAEILGAELIPASQDIADALGLNERAAVIRRQRLYLDDLGIVALSTSWLPGEFAEAAPELLATEPLPKMTFGLVEERTGRRAVRRRDIVAVQPVPKDTARVLNVATGSPALTMTNLYWDQNGEATEYAVDFLAADRELSAEYNLD